MNRNPKIIRKLIKPNGGFPNNARLPLVVYQQAHKLSPDELEQLIRRHGWGGSWRWGLYTYHHYHSTAHETLCVYCGRADIQFGGPGGPVVRVTAGDVVIIPAGLAHKNTRSTHDFRVVGCYPPHQSPDMQTGQPGERPATDRRIAAVPLPPTDPIYGSSGPLRHYWN